MQSPKKINIESGDVVAAMLYSRSIFNNKFRVMVFKNENGTFKNFPALGFETDILSSDDIADVAQKVNNKSKEYLTAVSILASEQDHTKTP